MVTNNILGIDASNISTGGGLTHLVELLNAANPTSYGFKKVVIWSSKSTLSCIKNHSWLKKCFHKSLDKNLLNRVFWQKYYLNDELNNENCNLLFVPGGSFVTSFRPIITISQNLLPFELKEIYRYGLSFLTLKFLLLRYSQTKSFKNADGVIFLTKYAQKRVIDQIGLISANQTVIPHGLDSRFFVKQKKYLPLTAFSLNKLIKVIYVSSIEPYKHQLNVLDAISILRNKGIPVALDLIGQSNKANLIQLKNKINEVDPDENFVRYYGEVAHSKIKDYYDNADIAIFASSCETFGQILIEGMASGLPTACSNMSAMSEILGDSGIYFDPLDPYSIANNLKILIESQELRLKNGSSSIIKAKKYSWSNCADQTFNFLRQFLDS